jgi:serine/threonine protein kinase
VILYHAVSGRVPFAGASLAQVIGQILHASPVPLRESVADIPQAFEAIVLCLMEKDPARRFQDARSLGQALLPFTSDRVALTYRAEFDAAENSSKQHPALFDTAAISGKPGPLEGASHSTLSLAARSVATTIATPAPGTKLVTWAAVLALALVGAALAFWPRTAQQTETTVQPALVPAVVDQTPAARAAPPPPAAAPLPAATPLPAAAIDSPKTQPIETPADIEKTKPKATKSPKPARSKPTAAAAPASDAPLPTPREDVWGNRK